MGIKLDNKVFTVSAEKFDEEQLKKELEEPIDYTTTETVETLVKVNAMFSAAEKISTGYKCALDGVHSCSYFTDKETELPYLEIHQIIPRDYAGEFDVCIERASNYVALCPHCHRMIHNAIDSERFKALRALYHSRKERLDADGIVPTNELLFAVYGIEQEKLNPGENDFSKPLLNVAQPKLAAGKSSMKTKAAKSGKRSGAKKTTESEKN